MSPPDPPRHSSTHPAMAPAIALSVTALAYALGTFTFYSWESYLWSGAIDGLFSIPDMYQSIHPDRPRLPDLVNIYHPNHALTHLVVAGLSSLLGGVSPQPALVAWLVLNRLAGLVLVALSYKIGRQVGGSPTGAATAAVLAGLSSVQWNEAINADAHIIAAAAGAGAVSMTLRLLAVGGDARRAEWVRLGGVYLLALLCHLNNTVIVTFLSLWLLWNSRREALSPSPLLRTLVTTALVAIACYLLPFVTAIDQFDLQTLRQTFLLNPAHGSGPGAEGILAASATGIANLARALVPGFGFGSRLLQIFLLGSLLIGACGGVMHRDLRTRCGPLLLAAGLFFYWIVGVVGSPNSSNYWIHMLWIVVVAGMIPLTRIVDTYTRSTVISTTLACTMAGVVGANVWVSEIAPRRTVTSADIFFSAASLSKLDAFDRVLVSVSDPHTLMYEAAELNRHLPSGRVEAVFQARGSSLDLSRYDRLQTVAVIAGSLNDPAVRALQRDTCWQGVWRDADSRILPAAWFRFSTDWGRGRDGSYRKRVVVVAFERALDQDGCHEATGA